MKLRLDAQILDVLRTENELSAREILAKINKQRTSHDFEPSSKSVSLSSCCLEVYHLCFSLVRLETKGLIRSRYEKNLNRYKPGVKYYRFVSGDSV